MADIQRDGLGMAMLEGKHLVMLSTAGRGGMRAVVDAYERDGVFERWNVRVLYSHVKAVCCDALAPRRWP